jgi:hypothetical protein
MAPAEPGRAVEVVGRLVAVTRLDPVYRDLYLRRARALFSAVCPAAEVERLRGLDRGLGRAERETRDAVLAGDWPRVKRLAAGITSTHALLDDRRAELELAAAVYDPVDVPFDPFSPGLESMLPGRPDPAALLAAVREGLVTLERLDPEGGALYGARRRWFDALEVGPRAIDRAAPGFDPAEAEVEALEDLRRGRYDELGRLAQRMVSRHVGGPGVGDVAVERNGAGARLAEPFPGDAVGRARGLGLAPAALPAEPAVAEYLRRVAWKPSFAQAELLRDGAARVEEALADPAVRSFREHARETLSLFAMHPYLNSGGARYLPRPVAETVLVEDFPEGEGSLPASRLLDALGLDHRRGLSRVEIERALLAKAPDIVERDLGLDPAQYQIVCVPSDVYNRAGAERGWGRAPLWTHFDGYQLMRSGHLRALVGGDVRYGGRADLVSIARDDARDKVILRLAVVRRERLLGRWL